MTRIMIDTNIFISAILFPNGRVAFALQKALLPPYQAVTCDYVVNELRRKFSEKFPDRVNDLDEFLLAAFSIIEVVHTPKIVNATEKLIRDDKDRPILRAALDAGADYLITGDKDFLESAVNNPKIISVADFLEM